MQGQRGNLSSLIRDVEYRILTVSKPCVTVTAPHAAIPPAMNDLSDVSQCDELFVSRSLRLTRSSLKTWRKTIMTEPRPAV